eukprot:TRINITY_DN77_c0_g1_i1.p1 TRINITY_DN77_c0_g1~~TRINITY_DN77_c0_g1_i1.p1  ORF type:complete len:228 (-),score=46.36 TRINITY_DN77_c0_g1_i1:45-671(-)
MTTLTFAELTNDFKAIQVINGDDYTAESFVKALKEFNKIFDAFGAAFYIVQSEVASKVETIESFQNKINGESFVGLKEMIQLEIKHNLTQTGKYPPNGTRTVIRLVRTLEFFIRMLSNLRANHAAEDCVYYAASEAYSTTLYQYHTWAVRTAASAALYACPYKSVLFTHVGVQEDNVNEEVTHFIDMVQPIVDNLNAFYTKHDLHNVP